MEPILSEDSIAGVEFVPIGTYKKFGDVTYALAFTVKGVHDGKTAKERAHALANDYRAQGYLTHVTKGLYVRGVKKETETYQLWLSKPQDTFYEKALARQILK